MFSMPSPKKSFAPRKSTSPMLPESPPKVNRKIHVVSTEKQIKTLAKFHRKNKFNILSDDLEIKKLKMALEARNRKTIVNPRIKIRKPKLVMSTKPPAKTDVKNDSCPKRNPLDNHNCYCPQKDVRLNLIVISHIMGQLKSQYLKFRK